ncbi:ABC transporter permease [Rhizobium sp. Root1204]|uniref:ABC transporter permease n=1 Tax=Rhizobium sp. Root1204 TaxID=1736428 RepID=UPI0007129E01|nr:ABC transporter permease [Rhizobium sp. Root1204]KQV41304.1 hypothetical protein ASC96_18595 [Rhizobium sp. Root1204]
MSNQVRSRTIWIVGSFAVAAFWVLLWSKAVDARLLPAAVLPSPLKVWQSLVRGFSNGSLIDMMISTTNRMLYGWLLASAIGILMGAAIGMSRTLRALLGPTLEMLRPIPAAAMLPVGLAFFGLTETMVLFCIAIASGWPTLMSSVHGFSNIEVRHQEVAQALGLSWLQAFWKISLPSALPDIFSGMRLSLTISLIVACLGEWIVSKPGLGRYIFFSSENFRAPDVFAGIAMISVIAIATTTCLSLFEARLLRWNTKR